MPIQKITTGVIDGTTTFANTQISGTITASQIAAVNANTITSGTIPVAQIPQLTGAKMPTGSVLQVVSTTKTDTFTTTSTSFTDITGLSVSITPTSATSKILVIYSSQISTTAGEYSSFYQMVRGSTAICLGDANGSRTRATNWNRSTGTGGDQTWVVSQNYLDSPSTTSATTYKIQGYVQSGGTFSVNRSISWGDASAIATGTSTITVMEIAA